MLNKKYGSLVVAVSFGNILLSSVAVITAVPPPTAITFPFESIWGVIHATHGSVLASCVIGITIVFPEFIFSFFGVAY